MTINRLTKKVRYSVLDLSPILEGGTAAESLNNTADLARHAENWGYHRYWLAEHHNMPGIASSATSVVIGHVASHTDTIRVGSGGIMLPNHSPLVIAEQFGTLESLFPGRIDLGLGRAPGTDQLTAAALRRDWRMNADDFPNQVDELRAYFDPSRRDGVIHVRAVPGEGLDIPIWLLGSSGFSARLAGQLGLPFAFASHFAPENVMAALKIYRQSFQPSNVLEQPYCMVGINIVASETAEKAEYLATSMQQQFLSLLRNKPGKLQPPVKSMAPIASPYELTLLEGRLASTFAGTKEHVKELLHEFLTETETDEVIINAQIFDHSERLKSFELAAEIMKELNGEK
ncbi:LLM class flavin-dependent oxidoreductase [Bacillus sp. B-jedd]|uniref:LLM class flavin-dependent oxidoreductase n=1 Tax=Bacillus sp. B-jedd TaxID=1476857 RepID=UPI000515591D|nr:LLM class flavin-dependent oxidoreductase [Bacillus sp. B-jedd]CEG27281.1 luciferase family alkanal oxidoreductase [Bacillus sp. B-jedd]